jgi:hemerythrin superfamily protein
MKATQLLMVDHEEVMTMLNTLAGSDMDATDAALFGRVKDVLALHTAVEEAIFYPALRSFPETKHLIEESYLEHKEIDSLIASMTPGTSAWDDQISELRSKVEQHAEEEESELFPQAEALLGEQQLLRLGHEIQAMKVGRSATA